MWQKPVVLVRSDFRTSGDPGMPYNAMPMECATIRLDPPLAPVGRVVAGVLAALRGLEGASR